MSKSPRIRESKPKDLSRAFRKKGRKGVRKAGEKTHLTSNVTDSLIASFAKLRKHDKSTVTYRLTELYLSGLTLNQPACPGKRHSEDKPGSPPPPPHFLSPSQHPNRKRLHTTLLPFSGQISDSLNHLRSLTCEFTGALFPLSQFRLHTNALSTLRPSCHAQWKRPWRR